MITQAPYTQKGYYIITSDVQLQRAYKKITFKSFCAAGEYLATLPRRYGVDG